MYKLINKQTNEEHICSKVVIDGFDYYYIDELIPYNPNGGTNGNFVCLGEIESNKDHNVKLGDKQYISPFVKNVGDCGGCRKLITTNNPSIDLPKVVDEIEILSQLEFPVSISKGKWGLEDVVQDFNKRAFTKGYNKSQESHPFSEKDMIEFMEWFNTTPYAFEKGRGYQTLKDMTNKKENHISTKELLEIWKEQRVKTIYYV